MKLSLAYVTSVLLTLCLVVLGQDVKKVQEPEYPGIFFLLDSSTGNLIPLERQTPDYKINGRGMGSKTVTEIKGARSPIRFKEGQTLEFVVLVSSQQIDPHGSLLFFSLESQKDKRQLITNVTGSSDKSVPFNATKYGTSSFRITSAQNLSPGEYFLGGGAQDRFCFGIDPSDQKP